MSIFKKNTEKHTEKLPMTGKVKKGFRIYCTAIMGAALILGTSVMLVLVGSVKMSDRIIREMMGL